MALVDWLGRVLGGDNPIAFRDRGGAAAGWQVHSVPVRSAPAFRRWAASSRTGRPASSSRLA